MGLKDRIRQGVDRATFEADRMLRANRAQEEMATLNQRIDKELRDIGLRVIELHGGGDAGMDEFGPTVERVQALRAEVVDKQRDLEGILGEHAVSVAQAQQATV